MSDPAVFRNRLVLALALLAIPGYGWCLREHVCMAGHLQHPPYPVGSWVLETLWIAGMVGSGVFSLRSTLRFKGLLFAGMAFLLLSRLLLGSAGGFFVLFEAPLVLVLLVAGVVGLLRSLSSPAHAPPPAPPTEGTAATPA